MQGRFSVFPFGFRILIPACPRPLIFSLPKKNRHFSPTGLALAAPGGPASRRRCGTAPTAANFPATFRVTSSAWLIYFAPFATLWSSG